MAQCVRLGLGGPGIQATRWTIYGKFSKNIQQANIQCANTSTATLVRRKVGRRMPLGLDGTGTALCPLENVRTLPVLPTPAPPVA